MVVFANFAVLVVQSLGLPCRSRLADGNGDEHSEGIQPSKMVKEKKERQKTNQGTAKRASPRKSPIILAPLPDSRPFSHGARPGEQ